MAQSASDGPQSVSECWYRIVFMLGDGRSTRYLTGVRETADGYRMEGYDHLGYRREWSKQTPYLSTQLGSREELPPKIREELDDA
jgi:hypothetical protein